MKNRKGVLSLSHPRIIFILFIVIISFLSFIYIFIKDKDESLFLIASLFVFLWLIYTIAYLRKKPDIFSRIVLSKIPIFKPERLEHLGIFKYLLYLVTINVLVDCALIAVGTFALSRSLRYKDRIDSYLENYPLIAVIIFCIILYSVGSGIKYWERNVGRNNESENR